MAKPILVLGATGYTGERIARALAARGADLILAARRSRPLQQLAEVLHVARPVRVIESLARVDALFQDAGVVVNTIGPYKKHGLPIVAAAIDHEAHYVDITGEQGFLRSVLDLLDGPARSRWVSVLCAQACEYAFGYCGTAALAERFGPPEAVDIFYRLSGPGFSHGTAESVIGMLGERMYTWHAGRLAALPQSRKPATIRFPGETKEYSGVPYPGGECLFIPRMAPGVKDVNDYLIVPRRVAGIGARLMAPGRLLRGAMNVPGVRSGLDQAIHWFVPEPPADKQAESQFTVLVRASRGNAMRYCRMQGRDIYGTSAQIAAQVAVWLSEGKSRARGVLATPQAFGSTALLDALAPHGVTYDLGML